MVRNIAPSIPLTAKDDYPFNVTINWDPPAFEKLNPVYVYLVSLFVYRNNSCDGRISLDLVSSHRQVSWLIHYKSRFWCFILYSDVTCNFLVMVRSAPGFLGGSDSILKPLFLRFVITSKSKSKYGFVGSIHEGYHRNSKTVKI